MPGKELNDLAALVDKLGKDFTGLGGDFGLRRLSASRIQAFYPAQDWPVICILDKPNALTPF